MTDWHAPLVSPASWRLTIKDGHPVADVELVKGDARKTVPERAGLAAFFRMFAVVGAIFVAVGVLLGGQFLWSVPDLVRAAEDAARDGHLTLVLLGAAYGSGRAVLLMAAGILLLLRRGRRRSRSD